MLILGPFGERLALVWLVPLVRLVQVSLGVYFALVTLLSGLVDFIL